MTTGTTWNTLAPMVLTDSMPRPPRASIKVYLAAPALVALAMLTGCMRDMIPNTDVEDTSQNREVLAFVERYRNAVEDRDVGALINLASARYYDDNGTPSGEDDLDYDGLRGELTSLRDSVLAIRYEIKYRRVTYDADRIFVDYTYTGSYRVGSADSGSGSGEADNGGHRWSRRLADNRLVLAREGDGFKILSGM